MEEILIFLSFIYICFQSFDLQPFQIFVTFENGNILKVLSERVVFTTVKLLPYFPLVREWPQMWISVPDCTYASLAVYIKYMAVVMSVCLYLVIIINVVNIVPCINMFCDVSCTCMFQSMYVHCTFFQRNLFNFITKILGHILTFFLFFF